MSDREAREPLLSVSVDVPADAAEISGSQDNERSQSIQRNLFRNPREAIKRLEGGVKKLGTFRVQVDLCLVLTRRKNSSCMQT